MAITRSQYVTVDELNEILGTDEICTFQDDSATKQLIYVSSEQLKQYCFDWNLISATDYTTVTAPNGLKLATAYQVEYNNNNIGIDDEYASASGSVTIGKTSESFNDGGSSSKEYKKIAPKAKRYLQDAGLVVRKLC